MILVGQKAPNFNTQAIFADNTDGTYDFHKAIEGKYALLFFYPLDFTFVCPTELLAVHNRMSQFKELGVEVCGVSIDSHFTHLAWRNTAVEDGGIGQVDYTLAADMAHEICKAYGVETVLNADNQSKYPAGASMRATFIIDDEGIVRHMSVNDEPLGRNFDEFLRLIKGYKFFKENGRVCNAGWMDGDQGFTPGTGGNLNEFLSDNKGNL